MVAVLWKALVSLKHTFQACLGESWNSVSKNSHWICVTVVGRNGGPMLGPVRPLVSFLDHLSPNYVYSAPDIATRYGPEAQETSDMPFVTLFSV